ncbi:MAG: hypothetical protein QXI19_02700 [Candidatus Caldarchaeum sp.]
MKAARKTSLGRFFQELAWMSENIDRLARLYNEGRLANREDEEDEVYLCSMRSSRARTELEFFMDETLERMKGEGHNRNLRKLFDACSSVCDDLREIDLATSAEEVLQAARKLKEDLRRLTERAKRYLRVFNYS